MSQSFLYSNGSRNKFQIFATETGDKMINPSPRQLGRMLAYLECAGNKKKALSQTAALSEADMEILATLKRQLNDAFGSAEPVQSTVFDAEKMYRKKTIDTCIRQLFSLPENAAKNKDVDCNIIIREMNDDFYFFENYSEIMRGYLLGKQEFTKSS